MSEVQETQEEKQSNSVQNEEMTLGQAVGKSFLPWIKTVFYFVVLPYKIWKASTFRLAKNADKAIVSESEEFPMYKFQQTSMDATIFILGLLAVPLAFVGVGFAIYFLVIPMLSFIKEIITMSLVTVQKLELISENTKK